MKAKKRHASKMVLVVTIVNGVAALLLVLAIYAVMLALAVIAPETSSLPVLILLGIVVPLSMVWSEVGDRS
jgi:membrane-anchored glycerophosphoryl diester phosphodiesterase (GDPDase)